MRRGASSWRRSPIRRAWPTRRTRRRFFGRQRTRLIKVYLFHYFSMFLLGSGPLCCPGRAVWFFLARRHFVAKTPPYDRWISLDSLVRIEPYQWVMRDFRWKIFPRPLSPTFASRRREPPILEGEGAGLFIG